MPRTVNGTGQMYVRSATTLWPQLGTNDILGGLGERLGTRVALSGDGSTVAVDVLPDEAPSLVRIYSFSDERQTWGLGLYRAAPAPTFTTTDWGNGEI